VTAFKRRELRVLERESCTAAAEPGGGRGNRGWVIVSAITAGGISFSLSSLFLLIFLLSPCYNPNELHSQKGTGEDAERTDQWTRRPGNATKETRFHGHS
jgi:hypothetical protein